MGLVLDCTFHIFRGQTHTVAAMTNHNQYLCQVRLALDRQKLFGIFIPNLKLCRRCTDKAKVYNYPLVVYLGVPRNTKSK